MITPPELALYAAGIVVGIVFLWWAGLIIIGAGLAVGCGLRGLALIVHRMQGPASRRFPNRPSGTE